MQNQSIPTLPFSKMAGYGDHDLTVLRGIDSMVAANDRGSLASVHVVDQDSGRTVPAGVYWVRASVDRNILMALGRDPAAMTQKEYWLQGPSLMALGAGWAFDREVEQERARHEAALKRQHARAAKALLGQVGVNGHVH